MPIERLKKEESELRKKILIRMMKQFAKGLTMHQFCNLINKRVFFEKKWQVAYTTIRTIKNQYNKEHIGDPINFIDGSGISSADIVKYNKQAEDSKLLKEQLEEYMHLFKTDKDKLIEIYKKKKAEESKKPQKPQKTQPTKQTYEEYKKQIEENDKYCIIISNTIKYCSELLSQIKDNSNVLIFVDNKFDEVIEQLRNIYDIKLTNQLYNKIIKDIYELITAYKLQMMVVKESIEKLTIIFNEYELPFLTIQQYEELNQYIQDIYEMIDESKRTNMIILDYETMIYKKSREIYDKYTKDMKEYRDIVYDFKQKHPDLNQEDYPENIKNAIRTIRKYIIDNNLLDDIIEKDNKIIKFKEYPVNEEKFEKNEDIISYTKDNTSLELLKQRELDDTTEKYLLQKELMVLEKKILETFKFLIEELFNGEILEYDKDITRLLKDMYKDGLEGRASGEFNVYQLESILRQINQMDPTSKLKTVIDIYQKFKGEQSTNTVNILNQAGEIKVGGATHKVFNDLDQTNFLEMIDTLEEDLTEKNNNED